ncbi:glycosyltransferase family 2 protein [Tenacibaculum sp. C7A-26P2]|uniref:glycosyltransferase family 2 protein n=1 Tax=Tenacibaculum sp. C7A-26P2 TaxID=3447504 RepID=UPI003F87DEE6
MNKIEYLFFICLIIILYTYVGYGIILFILVKIKQLYISKNRIDTNFYQPEVTLIIPAYNECDIIDEKMDNTMNLNYPKDKLSVYWVIDGSDDESATTLKQFDGISVFYKKERRGKTNAINRVMPFVKTEITIFTDANAILNRNSIVEIINEFKNKQVGCVSGEKRIKVRTKDKASGSGEGFYWKYESFLKKLDNKLFSVVGAAGELFAIRTQLFDQIEDDTILDDFVISLRIALKGYKIAYTTKAYALENASATIKDEFARKVRICAGGIQAIVRLKSLLNIFKYKTLSFQYISHRVLRWTITPLCLFAIIPINIIIINHENSYKSFFYTFYVLQILFYIAILIGFFLKAVKIKIRFIFIPYYFFIMNVSALFGFINYLQNKKYAIWKKVNRDQNII